MPAKHFDRGHGPLLQGLRVLMKKSKRAYEQWYVISGAIHITHQSRNIDAMFSADGKLVIQYPNSALKQRVK